MRSISSIVRDVLDNTDQDSIATVQHVETLHAEIIESLEREGVHTGAVTANASRKHRMGATGGIPLDIQSMLDCRVRIHEFNDAGKHCLRLSLDMEQEGDRRHAEVLLDGNNVEDIYAALGTWLKGPGPT